MPEKKSTADIIIEYGNIKGVSIFLDGSAESDSAKIGTPYSYFAQDKELTIFLVNLKSTTKEQLIPFLREKWEELGILLKSSQKETLESYITYKENHTDKDIIDFFTDKIPSTDLDALKMSLFLRSEKGMNRDISLFKQQIRERFGERGAYISNLCNSGYFENDFMIFYESSPGDFDKFYELSVGRELKAIFVHAGMTHATLRNIFEDKLIKTRRYQLNSFKIHGFGGWNVDLIKAVLEEYKNDTEGYAKEFKIKIIEEETLPPSIIYDIILISFQED